MTPVNPAIIKAVNDSLDGRYASRESVTEVLAAVQGVRKDLDADRQARAEAAAAPAILHADNKDDKKLGRRYFNVSKALFAQLYQRSNGVWPQGRDAEEAREYDFIKSMLPALQQKAFSVGTTTAGGFLIPEEWESEVIPTLKSESVIFAMVPGANVRQTKRDVFHWPAFNAKKTFAWSAENTAATEGTPTTREIVLTPKKAIGLAAVSTEWLEDGDPGTDAALRSELLGELAEFLDLSMLEGSGSNRPTGLRTIASINTVASGGALDYNDLVDAEQANKVDNVRPPFAWIMHPTNYARLRKLKDSDGRPLFDPVPNAANPVMPLGYPVFESSQIATNEGASSNESYILLVRPDEVVIAQRRGVTVALSEHAGFASDQVQIRLTARFDINVKHVEAICAITGITS